MSAYEHMVFFRFKPQVPQSTVDDLMTTLLTFPRTIPGILEMSAGINETEETGNIHGYTLGLRITFEDQQTLRVYQSHSEHQSFIQKLNGILESVIVMDYPFPTRDPNSKSRSLSS